MAQLGNKLGSKRTRLAQKALPFLLAPSAVEHQVYILDDLLCERLFQTAPRDHQKNVGGKGGVPKKIPKSINCNTFHHHIEIIWKLKGFTLVENGPPAEAAPCIADFGLENPCAGSATNINRETKPKQPT